MRKTKETNRHIKKYRRVRVWGNALYTLCLVAYFVYWAYFGILWFNFHYDMSIVNQFPFTSWKIAVATFVLPFISLAEYFYEVLCKSRADNVITRREKWKAIIGIERWPHSLL